MTTAKACGYGIKVTANDPGLNPRDLALNMPKYQSWAAEYIHPFFADENFEGPVDEFKFLALSFKDWIEKEGILISRFFNFVFLDDSNSFAIITRDTSSEIHDGVIPDPPRDTLGWAEFTMMRQWANDFFRSHRVEWLTEDVAPESVGKWLDKDRHFVSDDGDSEDD